MICIPKETPAFISYLGREPSEGFSIIVEPPIICLPEITTDEMPPERDWKAAPQSSAFGQCLRRLYFAYCVVAGAASATLVGVFLVCIAWTAYVIADPIAPQPEPPANVGPAKVETPPPMPVDPGPLGIKVLVDGVEPKTGEKIVCIIGKPPKVTVQETGAVHRVFWRTRPELMELPSRDPRTFYVTTVAEIEAALEVFVVDKDPAKDVLSATVNLQFQRTTAPAALPATTAKKAIPPEEDPEGTLIREIKAVNSASRLEDQKKQAAGLGLALGSIAAGAPTPDMLTECKSQALAMIPANASAWSGFWSKVQYLFTFWAEQGITSDAQGRVMAKPFLEKMGRIRQLLETTK